MNLVYGEELLPVGWYGPHSVSFAYRRKPEERLGSHGRRGLCVTCLCDRIGDGADAVLF